MADFGFERVRRRIDAPVQPFESFARSLLERLEHELAGEIVDIRDEQHRRGAPGLSPEELERQGGEELPLREAMSVVDPNLAAPTKGAPIDEIP